MPRTMPEILKDIDSSKTIAELICLWNEIVKHKKQYPLVEIRIAKVKIKDYSLVVEGSDMSKGSFYLFLDEMLK